MGAIAIITSACTPVDLRATGEGAIVTFLLKCYTKNVIISRTPVTLTQYIVAFHCSFLDKMIVGFFFFGIFLLFILGKF